MNFGGMPTPPGLAALFGGHNYEDETANQVIVGTLEPSEVTLREQMVTLKSELARIDRQKRGKEGELEAVTQNFWLSIEERLGVPSNVNLALYKPGGNNTVTMDREDAQKLGINYTEINRESGNVGQETEGLLSPVG